MNIDENKIDKLIESSEKKVKKTIPEILNDIKNSKPQNVKNPISNQISLGNLGNYDKISEEDVKTIFEKLPGIVFKIQKGFFRICYVNDSKKRFTAELLNS